MQAKQQWPYRVRNTGGGRERIPEIQRLVYDGLPFALAANTALALLFGLVLAPAIPLAELTLWLSAMGGVQLARAYLLMLYRRGTSSADDPTGSWILPFRVGAMLTGATWGAATLLLPPLESSLLYIPFFIIVLAGVSTGATTSLAIDRVSVIGFVVPALLPVALLLMAASPPEQIMGLMVFLFLCFLGISAQRSRRYLLDNIQMRIDAIDQEKRLASVIEGFGAGTWEWNLTTDQVHCDAHWAEMLGYDATEVAELSVQRWLGFGSPENATAAEQALHAHAAAKTEYYDAEMELQHRDGRRLWMRDRGKVIRWSADGKPLLMSGIRTNITSQRLEELERQQDEERLRGLFELSPIGIALNDYTTGRFVEVNDALIAPTGYTRTEFLSLGYWDITPEEYATQEALQLRSLKTTGRYGPFEKEYIRKDGSRYPVLLNGMLVHDASGQRYIWSIIEDISERKRIDRMKNEFVSTVSHELRTPLTSILGGLGLAVGGKLGELPSRANKVIGLAHKNAERLLHLINDLLDFEKLLLGEMQLKLQAEALLPVVREAIELSQPQANAAQVRLQLEEPLPERQVKVDHGRLLQVLGNLLSNAIKFSPQTGKVSVTVTAADDRIRVSVTDQGPGIPASFHERIFDKFAQADSSDKRQKGGTGLGLSISKQLIERMHGSIGFVSTEGIGASFYFELPVAQQPE